MNVLERNQFNRFKDGLAAWKSKAVYRRERIRCLERRIQDLVKGRNRWKDEALRLRSIIRSLEYEIQIPDEVLKSLKGRLFTTDKRYK